jgi:hypothetical protein
MTKPTGRESTAVRLPLPPDEAMADLLRVRPTAEMPRPPKKKSKKK